MTRRSTPRTSWIAIAVSVVVAIGLTATAAEAAGERSVAPPAPSVAPGALAPPASGARVGGSARPSAVVRPASRSGHRPEVAPQVLVRLPHDLEAHARPWTGSPVVGTVTAFSKYYRVPIVAWIEQVSADGRWGRLQLPYVSPRRDGWIPLDGLHRATTRISVHVDLSERRIELYDGAKRVYAAPAAVGAAASPTPPGRYFVTDRVAFSVGHYLGSFAFGISGIQPHLPAGWSGGNQLAIHGTNDPSSIGQPRSAGCVRVSETTLARLKPLLRLGTPVVVVP